VLLYAHVEEGGRGTGGKDHGGERNRQRAASTTPAGQTDGGDHRRRGKRDALPQAQHARLQAEDILSGKGSGECTHAGDHDQHQDRARRIGGERREHASDITSATAGGQSSPSGENDRRPAP
jgi:hypothetical protein